MTTDPLFPRQITPSNISHNSPHTSGLDRRQSGIQLKRTFANFEVSQIDNYRPPIFPIDFLEHLLILLVIQVISGVPPSAVNIFILIIEELKIIFIYIIFLIADSSALSWQLQKCFQIFLR